MYKPPVTEKAAQVGQEEGGSPLLAPQPPRAASPGGTACRGAEPPASPGAAALPSEAARGREEMQPNGALTGRLYFRWKEKNGKNKSKDHSD